MRIFGTLVYMALGLLVYLWLGEFTVFSWQDPWVFVYLMFWPIVLVWNAFLLAVVVVAAILICGFLYAWYTDELERKDIQKAHAAYEEKKDLTCLSRYRIL